MYPVDCSPPDPPACVVCVHLGDLSSEQSVFEWLTEDENRELDDEIESVNLRMLGKLLEKTPFLAAFFCEYIN